MVLYTYNRDIPDAPNNPSTDQPDIQQNTNSIDDLINVDHISFNQANGGIHKQVRLRSQGAPGLGDGQCVVYADTFNGNSWTAFQNSLGAFFLHGDRPSLGTNGWTSVAGPLLIQWGFVNGTHGADLHFDNADTDTVNFATSNMNFHSACYAVFAQPAFTNLAAPNGGMEIAINRTLSATSFTWKVFTNSSAYTRFFWVAIGQ